MYIVSHVISHSVYEFIPDHDATLENMEVWLNDQKMQYRTAKTSGMTGHLYRVIISNEEDYIAIKLRWA